MSQVCIFCDAQQYCQDCEGVGCIDCDYTGDCVHCGGAGYFIPPRYFPKGLTMFPVVRIVDHISGNPNGRNWPGLVLVKKTAPHRAAVVAQEAWESQHKMDPIKLFFRVFKRSTQDTREFEYMGHEVECQAKVRFYGVPIRDARMQEALSMRHGYDGIFSHMELQQIANEMRDRQTKALDWLNKNQAQLRKYV